MGRCWLFKSEPGEFSFEDLLASPERTTGWDGIRNYQARNILRDEVQVGDQVLFYHSSVRPPAVVGIAEVTRAGYPDRSDGSEESDPPRWFQVDIQAVRALPRPVSLDEMRAVEALQGMALLRRGNRLSVQPVSEEEWGVIVEMGGV